MGFLPIALALLGFLLLWGMVNYSTIKSKKAEAEIIWAEIKDLWRLKQEKVKFHNSSPESTIQKPGLVSPGYVAESNHRLMEIIKAYFNNTEKAGFTEPDRKLSLKLQQYRNAANIYNKLIKEIPTRFVAIVSGLKPLP